MFGMFSTLAISLARVGPLLLKSNPNKAAEEEIVCIV